MIECREIYKIYNNIVVIENFSYKFQDNGFYLLFGESGSGKTTFLNILSGLMSYESGIITLEDIEFKHNLDKEFMADKAEYITQDTFFVDFLNVLDNLKLVCVDESHITQMMERFGMLEKMYAYPATLSGGEKQRVAIVRALLSGKKILLLDEPTASLDQENKYKIFKMLYDIKDEILIICSSHDHVAMEYADEIISFEKKHNRCVDIDFKDREGQIEKTSINKFMEFRTKKNNVQKENEDKKIHIRYFLKQWFSSNKRSRTSSVLFCLFLVIAMGVCLLAETPQNRINSNIEFIYKINMCMLRTYGEDVEEYYRLQEMEGVKEVVLEYRSCLPLLVDSEQIDEIIMLPSVSYETTVPVLPFEQEVFRLSDKIIYGTYFTEANQMILTRAMAESLVGDSEDRIASLIGQTMIKEFYGIGEVELEIVGIFDHFDEIETAYMQALEVEGYALNEGMEWFINGKLAEQMVNDETLYAGNQRVYTLYFESYDDLKHFYDEHREYYFDRGDYLYINAENGKLLGLFDLLYKVCLPLAFFMAIFTVLFYANLMKTELIYNNQFIAVMDYAGYSVKKVVNYFVGLNILHLLKNCSFSMLIALVITGITNWINEKYMFLEFKIFSYNIPILLGFTGVLILCSVVFLYLFLKPFKKITWYENIIKNRDLI